MNKEQDDYCVDAPSTCRSVTLLYLLLVPHLVSIQPLHTSLPLRHVRSALSMLREHDFLGGGRHCCIKKKTSALKTKKSTSANSHIPSAPHLTRTSQSPSTTLYRCSLLLSPRRLPPTRAMPNPKQSAPSSKKPVSYLPPIPYPHVPVLSLPPLTTHIVCCRKSANARSQETLNVRSNKFVAISLQSGIISLQRNVCWICRHRSSHLRSSRQIINCHPQNRNSKAW